MKSSSFLQLLAVIMALSSCGKSTLFRQIPASESGIDFVNRIEETDSVNPLTTVNIYNGGGVGVGDFNNDGLQDLYFTGNQVSNRLYINKGDLKFRDITEEAGVSGQGRWSRGVSVVDINHDGWQDIYVCVTLAEKPEDRQNLLYINQGKQPDGTIKFLEKAREYGLNDSSHSTMANFFDYDLDGDLDMYLVVNEIGKRENPNKFRPIVRDGSAPSTGRLYQNNWDPVRKHPVFSDVSARAGITIEGYGHGTVTSDLNRDGWPDIYVSNDFVSNNILYINNRDGTFTDQSRTYFKHTAANAMGLDITDINNDGLSDVIELDMNPQDNYRKKMMMGANSYQTYQNFDYYGYQYQYVRNTLQVNQGPRVGENDSLGAPVFSETAFFSGIAETDWSWAPVVADFDNDGLRDIVITNGYPRDVTDRDFMTFRDHSYSVASVSQLLEQIPVIKLHNYGYRNTGGLVFENVTQAWGLSLPTFSNGAVYADLDNDGDMEMVINNINDEALLYKNTSRESTDGNNHYLHLALKGEGRNPQGIGAWVDVYYRGGRQVWENTPYRGYLSSVSGTAHFGLGGITEVDSVIIRWPDRRTQVIRKVQADQLLVADISESRRIPDAGPVTVAKNTLFTEVTGSLGLRYVHQARDIVDFNTQKLLPHKLSEYHPALAIGDINNDGTEDLVIGGSSDYPARAFLQQKNGSFTQQHLVSGSAGPETFLDMGLLLFDADGDGDLDLYAARGGYEAAPHSAAYQDQFFRNDGKGRFAAVRGALPENFTSKSVVRSIDYDKDGDLDLFVAGRVEPWHYPKPVSSFIFRNDSGQGAIRFTDVTPTVAPDLTGAGLVCDGLFTDFDNDGWQDMVIAGEWMPLTFLKNDRGKFRNVTGASGISDKKGFWNSLAPGDFDNDGDIDYVVGNHGWNTFYRASEQLPVYLTAKDFDKNGSYDAIPSLFLPDQEGRMREFPAHTRDDMVKQIISMRVRYQNYRSYATTSMDQLLTADQREHALRLSSNFALSSYIENLGQGKFKLRPLPAEAQLSMLNGMVAEDFTGDGNLDIAINGNDFGTEVTVGRYDALNGLVLQGDGKGNFKPLRILESGIFIPGNGKALAKLQSATGGYLLAASQNRGPLKVFRLKKNIRTIPVAPDEVSAEIRFPDGRVQKREIHYGSSFLSQSSRSLDLTSAVRSVSVIDISGKRRAVTFRDER